MPSAFLLTLLLTYSLHLPFDRAVALLRGHRLASWAQSLPPEIQGVVLDLKTLEGRVGVPFDHPLAPLTGAYDSTWDLREAVETLHRLGLRVIARVAVLRDSLLYQHVESPYVHWFTPQSSVALAYNRSVLQAVAQLPVDEIQLDYIRWPDTRNPKTPEQLQWRRRTLVSFVQRLLRGIPDSIQTSADLFGRVCFLLPHQSDVIGQHPQDFLELVDVLCPMMYPSHYWGALRDPYQAVYQSSLALLAQGIPSDRIRPWLQAFPMRLPDTVDLGQYLTRQLEALQDAGVEDAMFWLPHMPAVTQALTAVVEEPLAPTVPLSLRVQAVLDASELGPDSLAQGRWAGEFHWIRRSTGVALYWRGMLCRVWNQGSKGTLPFNGWVLLTDSTGQWRFLWTLGEPRTPLQALQWPGGDARSAGRIKAWVLVAPKEPPSRVWVSQGKTTGLPRLLRLRPPGVGNPGEMPHTQTQQHPLHGGTPR